MLNAEFGEAPSRYRFKRRLCLAALTALCIALLPGPATIGQTARSVKARTFWVQAVSLHREGKHGAALAKLKQSLALDPRNRALAAYRAELEQLIADDETARHALKAPPEAEQSLDSLAAYLVQPAKSDRDKAYLIFRWVTDRITYNAAGYFAGQYGDNNPETVLRSRKAVCSGYSSLYEQLAKRAGLEVVHVRGYAKLAGVKATPARPKHAWNAVRVDGRWHLLDSTWGAGSMDFAARKFTQRYNPYHFLTPPEEFVLTHFPRDSQWQLLDTPVEENEFWRGPVPGSAPLVLGFKPAELRSRLTAGDGGPLVQCSSYPGPRVTVRAAPLEGRLRAGKRYRFRLESAGLDDFAIIMDRRALPLPKKGTVLEGEVVARKGKLMVGFRWPTTGPAGATYAVLLTYQVD